jgi:uncharacterized protein YjbJ (UPF0337 family)
MTLSQDINMKITHIKSIGLSAILALLVCSFGAYAEETKDETHLNMNKDQIKGRVDEAQGKAKEETGKLLDNKDMEVEGNVQKNVGKAQKGYGDTKKDIQEGK